MYKKEYSFTNEIKFSDLFKIVSKEDARPTIRKSEKWVNYDVKPPKVHRKGEDTSKIGNYFHFSPIGERESISVNATPFLIEWINNNMLIVNHDTIHFKAVVHSADSVDIYCEYGQIIGSRLLINCKLSDIANKKYRIAVKVKNNSGYGYIWQDLRPSGSRQPYEYDSKDEAQKIRDMCYPEQTNDQVKIYEV